MADRQQERRHQLGVLLDRLDRHDDEAVGRAVRTAEQDHDDPVDAAGAALVSLLRAAKVVDLDAGADPRWVQLPPGAKAMLLLVEVEQIPVPRVASLLRLDEQQVADAYTAACRAMGWEPLRPVACPGWPTVARLHRVGTEDGEAGIIHVSHCPRCAVWHFDRQDRRVVLADLAPWLGAAGLGYVLDPASI